MGREHPPVVRLSRVDAERIERGELADEADAVVQAAQSPSPIPGDSMEAQRVARTAGEERLIAELPPHFGKL